MFGLTLNEVMALYCCNVPHGEIISIYQSNDFNRNQKLGFILSDWIKTVKRESC